MNNDEIILFAREEADQIVGRVVSEYEWATIKEWVTTDDNMWEVIEQCIKNTVDEVIL